jgi:hypothetical protein
MTESVERSPLEAFRLLKETVRIDVAARNKDAKKHDSPPASIG